MFICLFAVIKCDHDPNPCYNGGTCNDTDEGFSCQCPQPFTGQQCEIGWCYQFLFLLFFILIMCRIAAEKCVSYRSLVLPSKLALHTAVSAAFSCNEMIRYVRRVMWKLSIATASALYGRLFKFSTRIYRVFWSISTLPADHRIRAANFKHGR